MITKLKNHKYSQCFIRTYNNIEEFWSYKTMVLQTNIDTNIMIVTGLYSNTTRKHISWYLAERFLHISYDTIKKAYDEKKNINIITTELV